MSGILTGRLQRALALALVLFFLAAFLHPFLAFGHVQLPRVGSFLHFSLPVSGSALAQPGSTGDLVRMQSRAAQHLIRQELFAPLLC